MELCSFCSNAYGYGKPSQQCAICNGACASLDSLLERAISHLKQLKVTEISFSTKTPKAWLLNEEKLFDLFLGNASIKASVNGHIARALNGAGFSISSDPRITVTFDLEAGLLSYAWGDLFVFGRYYKHVGGLSQSRWTCYTCSGKGCSECNSTGANYLSVEELIGMPFKEQTKASNYVLHASGREDVDVTNSAGRAFVLELSQAQNIPDLELVRKEIAKDPRVSVSHLTFVPRSFSEVVTESHFDKEYLATVEVEGGINTQDLSKLKALYGKMIEQQTPTRVAHRRADLVRKRRVLHYFIGKVEQSRFEITLLTEAGTYIKELISGDEGRTKPSISEMLGKKCVCTKLEVTKILDEVLDVCLEDAAN